MYCGQIVGILDADKVDVNQLGLMMGGSGSGMSDGHHERDVV